MKKFFLIFALFAMAVPTIANADLVSYYNFNSFPDITTASAPGNGGVPTFVTPDLGTGSLSLSGWSGLVDDFSGSSLNVLNSDPAGKSLSLVSNAGNGSYVQFTASMSGLENPIITFDTRGTSTGFNSGTWSWSTDGVNFTAVAGNTATTSTTYATAMVDFSSVNALDGASSVFFRYTLNGATSTSGNNRMDNVQINATAMIPEPSSLMLGAMGLVGLGLRRKRD